MNEPKQKKSVEVAIKQDHKNIYEALAAFQGELKPMAKTGHVEFPTKSGAKLSFDYTPLGEIMATIYPLLSKHGLSVRHEVTEKGVEAIVSHETYQVTELRTEERQEENKLIKAFINVPDNQIRSGVVRIGQGGDMKDTGSAITYARRYTLTMVLGISSEDDKDVSLLEQSGKNAAQFAYTKVKEGLDKAKTEAELEKQLKMLDGELKKVEGGKAGALGLTKEDYEALILYGNVRVKQVKEGVDTTIEKDEN